MQISWMWDILNKEVKRIGNTELMIMEGKVKIQDIFLCVVKHGLQFREKKMMFLGWILLLFIGKE